MGKSFIEQLEINRKQSTIDWYNKINQFKPVPGRDYNWIWEYAKFRFEWSFEKTRYVEEKGAALLKLVLAITAAVWIVFGGALRSHGHLSVCSLLLIGIGLCFLALSGHNALRASLPAEHVYPKSEDEAVAYANHYDAPTAASANFCLQFADSTEQERFVTMEKGHYIKLGNRNACRAVVFFTLALLCEVCRQTIQFSVFWDRLKAAVVFAAHIFARA